MTSPEDLFVPPTQPCRRWRYPGQNFAMIQQNRGELSWSERTRLWVNDVPTEGTDRDTQHGERKVLEELHDTNSSFTQLCKISSSEPKYLTRGSKRKMDGFTSKDEDDEGRGKQLSSSTHGPASKRGRPKGTRGRGVGVEEGSVRPTDIHNGGNEDNPLTAGMLTPNNPLIIQL